MSDRNTFYMFYGARENDKALCEKAVKSGADVNFPFNGRKGTKGNQIGKVEYSYHSFQLSC